MVGGYGIIISLHEPNNEVRHEGCVFAFGKNAASKLASIVCGFSQWFV